MNGKASSSRGQRFGVFEFNPGAGELRKQGLKIKLQGQPIEILAMLLERPGQVITREEIQKKLWPEGTNVEFEHSLNAAVKRLRDALDDSADTPRYIETLARRGYRFVGQLDGSRPITLAARTRRWVWTAGIAASAALAALIVFNIAGSRDRILGGSRKPIQSIAVLPLTNLSGDPEQDYFADGMTEALITELGKISALRVISRQSMMQYKGTKKSAPQIAQELHVEAIVEGSVLRSGDRVRISAQLIQASPERHLWANSYDRDLRDVLALHSDMARAVAGEVRAKLSPQEHGLLAAARPVNLKAYAAYLRGQYFWNRFSSEGLNEFDKAIDAYQEAIKEDPSYAPAYAAIAACYAMLGHWRPPKEVFPKARAAAMKALELDDTLAEAHSALAKTLIVFDWNWDDGERELKRAIQLNPNSSDPRWEYGGFLSITAGRIEEGLEQARIAQQLDPLSLLTNVALGWDYMLTRHYDEAIAQHKNTLELVPKYELARQQLFLCYILKGAYPEAFIEYKKLGAPEPNGNLALLYTVWGRKREALNLLKQLRRLPAPNYIEPYEVALGYAPLDRDRAFEWLEKAFEERSVHMIQMRAEPFFDPLRSDPRFQDLLRRMNFPSVN